MDSGGKLPSPPSSSQLCPHPAASSIPAKGAARAPPGAYSVVWESPSLLKAPLCLLQALRSTGSRQVGSIMPSCPLSPPSTLGAPSLGRTCSCVTEAQGCRVLSSTFPRPPRQTKSFSIALLGYPGPLLLPVPLWPSVRAPTPEDGVPLACSRDLAWGTATFSKGEVCHSPTDHILCP